MDVEQLVALGISVDSASQVLGMIAEEVEQRGVVSVPFGSVEIKGKMCQLKLSIGLEQSQDIQENKVTHIHTSIEGKTDVHCLPNGAQMTKDIIDPNH